MDNQNQPTPVVETTLAHEYDNGTTVFAVTVDGERAGHVLDFPAIDGEEEGWSVIAGGQFAAFGTLEEAADAAARFYLQERTDHKL